MGLINSSYGTPDNRKPTKIDTAYGGVIAPIPIFTTIIAPRCTRFTLKTAISGNNKGTAITIIGAPLINMPIINNNTLSMASTKYLLSNNPITVSVTTTSGEFPLN